VLPESGEQMLILRPLGGSEDEVTGIFMPLERVDPATFDLPDPAQRGDERSCRLLRDAVRLGFRSSAGPFRSFARIAVEPRPYQLVPLLMALKLEPVRLLIADDVGIGKTIEAALVARELIDRGEVARMTVLCPPQLAEQWQAELQEKFHLDAELVLASTASRLERYCNPTQSLFERYPYTIVSTDFIKSERRRDEFLRTCPELVIVDEAHTCADSGEGRGGRHQRYQLVSSLAQKRERHLVLVTATPHSGKEEAFRSLLTFLDRDFAQLPEDLTGKEHEQERRRLAAHFVQRRRADIRSYLNADTPFPERAESEQTYKLSAEYKRLIEKVMRYARETVTDPLDGNRHRQRVRWWSALALLRSMASSPAATVATLRSRAAAADTETAEEADEIGRHTVLDLVDHDAAEGVDLVPGSDSEEEGAGENRVRRRLLEMAREAEALLGAKDEKLQKAIKLVDALVKDGFQPIVFCRFIPTAEYVATALRERLPKGVQVEAVTGLLPPIERENRIAELVQSPQRVLVCTDCLSEGINLQEHFDAVFHYDLSWNPTRHEQREGRVDRYGQPRKQVRVVTYYGTDNQIDGIVLDVLLKKHQTIRSSLGISVPVPIDTDQVVEAIFEGLLLRENTGHLSQSEQLLLPGMDVAWQHERDDLFREWEATSEREKRSRTMFAQEGIKVDEVAEELAAVRSAIGSGVDVAAFMETALAAQGASVSHISQQGAEALQFDLSETPQGVRDATGITGNATARFKARFELPVQEGTLYLSRTHPLVEGLAGYVMDVALDPLLSKGSAACRCGVIRTSRVARRTTLLLVRLRFHIVAQKGAEEQQLLAEDCQVLAFAGPAQNAEWLSDGQAIEGLLQAPSEGNIYPEQAEEFLRKVLDQFELLRPHLEQVAHERGEELLNAHRRVRAAAQVRGVRYRVEPQLPMDVLGVYMYLPKGI
jgi:superfamily II DNA or RNA helicase